MKNILRIITSALLVAGCMQQVEQMEQETTPSVFTASFEETNATKTYVDEALHLFWTAEDRLSIFAGTTFNQQYMFKGKTGDTAGSFEEVKTSGFHSGSNIDKNYAIYPYDESTGISYDGVFTCILPAVQTYAEKSFGLGANTMVAVTQNVDDTFLPFKNVCGYLVVKLYGEGPVKSISLKSNNGEKIAGDATVSASYGENPQTIMSETATDGITIDCGESGIALGTTSSDATEFWFCIPPVTFSKGFTVTATNANGWSMVKTVSSEKTITRNVINSMPALEAIFDTREGNIEFEDANFKAYCVENFDKDGDGEISYEEAREVTKIECRSLGLKSLEGIECFPVLDTLRCSFNQLTYLDISKNTALSFLDCWSNQLTSLDVSRNINLACLLCDSNQLTSLDVSKNTALQYLYCNDNHLTSLDVINNTKLTELQCGSMPTLETLYVARGMSLPGVVIFRSIYKIPETTEIVVVGSIPVPEMVDLGLSVKWASFNLGAIKPEDYGGYYQWAGLEDLASSNITPSWSNCPYHTGSDYNTGWTKYIPSSASSYWSGEGSPDGKSVLDPEDDVVHVELGGKWRMPTSSEIQELIDNCPSEWTTLNGVEGRLFTSNNNGNSIFLPAVGMLSFGTRTGEYWYSRRSETIKASALRFDENNVIRGYRERYYINAVRPVSE